MHGMFPDLFRLICLPIRPLYHRSVRDSAGRFYLLREFLPNSRWLLDLDSIKAN